MMKNFHDSTEAGSISDTSVQVSVFMILWPFLSQSYLSDDKTEVLAISTPLFTHRLHETCIKIGDVRVEASESACSRGVIFNNSLEMSNHIMTVWTASFMQL